MTEPRLTARTWRKIVADHPLPWRCEEQDDLGFVLDANGAIVTSACPARFAFEAAMIANDYRPGATFRGKTVEKQPYRAILATVAFGIALSQWVLVSLLLLVLAPVWVPLDLVLKGLGRRGFYERGRNGRWLIRIGPKGFERTPPR